MLIFKYSPKLESKLGPKIKEIIFGKMLLYLKQTQGRKVLMNPASQSLSIIIRYRIKVSLE